MFGKLLYSDGSRHFKILSDEGMHLKLSKKGSSFDVEQGFI
jgi:hypothetical protein